MRRETKELTQSFILRPGEEKSIRCRNAFNRELKINKSRKACTVAIRENLVNHPYLGYAYKFTKRLNILTFDIAITDDTGRLKDYIPAGSKCRIKSHFIKSYISANKQYFTLYINDMLFPCLSLDNIKFSDNNLKIFCDEFTRALVYYTDIKSLEVL